MKKYQQLAEQLREQIASGIWQPGDRLPSLRDQVALSGMSFMTVSHAYQLLESQGHIIARPQSGYYVAPQAIKMPKAPVIPVTRDEAVDINTYIFDMLQASRDPSVVPFASAFPDPRLFPLQQLNRSLAQVSKTATAMSVIENLPPGNAELRQAIARRYALQGITISPDEIVITAGALEALNLSLQAVTEPGDWVIVENPCFYGALQALERLRLKALSVATDVKEGIDLKALELALQEYPVKACPKGIDIYYENVGGKVFDAVLPLLNTSARIPVCGLVSSYNATELPPGPDRLPLLMATVLKKRIRLQGFIIAQDYGHRIHEFQKEMGQWVKEDKIHYREEITDGLENAPQTFIGLLKGKNFGKVVIRVAGDD